MPVPKAFQLYNSSAYCGQKKFDLPPLYDIPEEDFETGDNDADAKETENHYHIRPIHKVAEHIESMFAKAIEIHQPCCQVPHITLLPKAPDGKDKNDLWVCSHHKDVIYNTNDIISHLQYHKVGLTPQEQDEQDKQLIAYIRKFDSQKYPAL